MIPSMDAGAEDMLVTFSVRFNPAASAWDVTAAVPLVDGADCLRDPEIIPVPIELETTSRVGP